MRVRGLARAAHWPRSDRTRNVAYAHRERLLRAIAQSPTTTTAQTIADGATPRETTQLLSPLAPDVARGRACADGIERRIGRRDYYVASVPTRASLLSQSSSRPSPQISMAPG